MLKSLRGFRVLSFNSPVFPILVKRLPFAKPAPSRGVHLQQPDRGAPDSHFERRPHGRNNDLENSPYLRSKERFVSFLINLFGIFIEAWEVGYRHTTRAGSLDLTSQLFSGRPAC